MLSQEGRRDGTNEATHRHAAPAERIELFGTRVRVLPRLNHHEGVDDDVGEGDTQVGQEKHPGG